MIGLLRCIGASRGQVKRSVLRTATLTGLVGSVAGAALGAGAAAAVVRFGMINGLNAQYLTITPVGLLVAVLLATVVALIAVLLPARRAARVSPLVAVTGLVAGARTGGRGRLWAALCGGLLVGLVSVNDSSERMTAESNPVDMAVFGVAPHTDLAALTAAVESVDGVEGTAYVPAFEVTSTVAGDTQSAVVNIVDPAQVSSVARSTSGLQDLKDGVLIVSEREHIPDGARVTLTGPAGSVEVTAHVSRAGWAPAVTPATAQRVSNGTVTGAVVWVRAAGDGTSPVVAQAVTEALRGQGLMVKDYSSVSADFLTVMRQVELVIALVMVAALVVCLIGLANTVDISVLERTREIGLLRATGLDQAGVRHLVVGEALLLALTGGLLGVVAGAGLGAAGSLAALGRTGLTVSLPVPALLGLVVITALIGVAASVRPAGRAAVVPPVMALAQE